MDVINDPGWCRRDDVLLRSSGYLLMEDITYVPRGQWGLTESNESSEIGSFKRKMYDFKVRFIVISFIFSFSLFVFLFNLMMMIMTPFYHPLIPSNITFTNPLDIKSYL